MTLDPSHVTNCISKGKSEVSSCIFWHFFVGGGYWTTLPIKHSWSGSCQESTKKNWELASSSSSSSPAFFFFGSFFRMRVRVCVELSGGDTRSSQQGRELCVFVYVHTCRWLPETFLPFIRKLNPRQRFSSCSWTRMSAREAQRRNNVLQLSYGERDRVRRREMGNNSSTLLSV